MVTIPRPKIEVVEDSGQNKTLVITRDEGAGFNPRVKSISIHGRTENERLENLGKDIINDRKNGEFLP